MNLYHVALWDATKGKNGETVYLSLVAENPTQALRAAAAYKGELTSFKLAQTGLIVV